MKKKLGELKKQFDREKTEVESPSDLEDLRVKYLGRNQGLITDAMKGIGSLPPDKRPEVGKLANKIRSEVEEEIEQIQKNLKETSEKGEEDTEIDITLPGTDLPLGKRHPISYVREQLEDIFVGMGYEIVYGPEAETDYNNFVALNTPKDHPAREEQATFFIGEEKLLRTHTSAVQVRTMKKTDPPLRIIAPGKVYRRDYDITHTPMFYQIEGLYVDENVTMSNLKASLEFFCKRFFGRDAQLRFRPSYFPFTEPSAEIDVSCVVCGGEGCRTCSDSGWIEILGAGMVDPEVFRHVDYDTDKYSGFAFGLGIDRMTMLKCGISDTRQFYINDMRFLSQGR